LFLFFDPETPAVIALVEEKDFIMFTTAYTAVGVAI